jgi:hypothetical protein
LTEEGTNVMLVPVNYTKQTHQFTIAKPFQSQSHVYLDRHDCFARG